MQSARNDLIKARLATPRNLAMLQKVYPVSFFHTLKNAGIPLSQEILNLIWQEKDLVLKNEVASIINKLLTRENLLLIMNNEKDLLLKKVILKNLKQYGLLTEKNLTNLLTRTTVFYLFKILDFLAANQIVLEDNLWLQKVIDNKTSEKLYYSVLYVLTKKDLVNTTNVNKIGKINSHNLLRLSEILNSLESTGLLNQSSFNFAFERISHSIHIEKKPYKVNKFSRKVYPHSESYFIVHDLNVRFYLEHDPAKKYLKGGFSYIKKGYDFFNVLEPKYAIKKFIKQEKDNENFAHREVKYNRLLGRNAFYYHHNNKLNIILDWQQGKSLDQFSSVDLLKIPQLTRIHFLLSGISELNILHQNYRVHGDIKVQNFMLDPKTRTMKLIDFSGAHKKGSKSLIFTQFYSDPGKKNDIDDFQYDIYSMGIVVAALFPELYKLTPTSTHVVLNQITVAKSPLEKAIEILINAMQNPKLEKRCTSEDVKQFCEEILKTSNLTYKNLEHILTNTIMRSTTSVEDVLRGKCR